MKHCAILLAGGSGSRMNALGEDKLLFPINSTNAFRLSYEAFLNTNKIDNVVIIYRDHEQLDLLELEIDIAHQTGNRKFDPILVKGGTERKDSVLNGLTNCPSTCEFVYVHDCARPMIRTKTINQLHEIVSETGAVAIARPLRDTIKIIEEKDTEDWRTPCTTKSVDRSNIWIMETPQVARKEWLQEGMNFASDQVLLTTDEVSVLELIQKKVTMLEIEYPNPKITSQADWPYLTFLLSSK